MSTARAESRAAFAAHADDGVAAVLEDFVRRTAQPGVQGEAVAGGTATAAEAEAAAFRGCP